MGRAPGAWWIFVGALPLLAAGPVVAGGGDGFTHAASLEHAAYHEPGAPDVIVHAPDGFRREAPLQLVVFLHGFRGCASVLVGAGPRRCKADAPVSKGWDLASRHDEAGTNTLFIVPQLAFMQRSGRPGCFARRGCFRRFLEELLGKTLAPMLGPGRGLSQVESITLVAHSAGFETALAILEQGEVEGEVRDVVLMDALYGGAPRFARWLESSPRKDARLVSIYLGSGKTHEGSRALYRRLRRRLGAEHVARSRSDDLAQAVERHRVVVAAGRAPHRRVPENYLATVLRALPLSLR